MKIYIAGPMTGIPLLNFPLFNLHAAELRAAGHDVVNPAELNGGADELWAVATMTPEQVQAHWLTCMRKDIAQLILCDAIFMLPGWKASRGASLEQHIAQSLGLKVYFAGGVELPELAFSEGGSCD